MRFMITSLGAILLIGLSSQSYAQEKMSYEEIQTSVAQLEHNWDNARKRYAGKFKAQLEPINRKIEELKSALDNGDPARRKEINDRMAGLKQSRDEIRQVLHEITATSIVKIGGIQKYFLNAKDDTKD